MLLQRHREYFDGCLLNLNKLCMDGWGGVGGNGGVVTIGKMFLLIHLMFQAICVSLRGLYFYYYLCFY